MIATHAGKGLVHRNIALITRQREKCQKKSKGLSESNIQLFEVIREVM